MHEYVSDEIAELLIGSGPVVEIGRRYNTTDVRFAVPVSITVLVAADPLKRPIRSYSLSMPRLSRTSSVANSWCGS